MAAAANVGVDRASGPSFALLNPDVRATSAREFERLEEAFEDDKVGAVAPAQVLPDGTLQDSARWVPTPVDLVVRRVSRADRGAVRVTHPVDVEWATAACLVVRRRAFDQIGGFDESYFLYFEDVDLCVRLRAAGFRVRYDPTVRVRHEYRAASRGGFALPRPGITFAARFASSAATRRRCCPGA